MRQLGAKGRQWLKVVHIALACQWLGGTISILLVQLVAGAQPGGELHGVHLSMKILDDFVIIPAAFGSLGTGLLYGWMTPWGFFQRRWIVFKWLATLGMIAFGAAFLGPWINRMEAMTQSADVVKSAQYQRDLLLSQVFGAVQAILLVFMVWLSVFKPWRRRGATSDSSD